MPLTNMNHVQSVFILGLACVCIKNLNVWDAKLLDSIQPHERVTGQKAA